MPHVEIREDSAGRTYWLGSKRLQNGDQIMLLLRGNAGWERVSVEGMPGKLEVRTLANDGHAIVTTLPTGTDVRWPKSTDAD
jgi:hypothetical protein